MRPPFSFESGLLTRSDRSITRRRYVIVMPGPPHLPSSLRSLGVRTRLDTGTRTTRSRSAAARNREASRGTKPSAHGEANVVNDGIRPSGHYGMCLLSCQAIPAAMGSTSSTIRAGRRGDGEHDPSRNQSRVSRAAYATIAARSAGEMGSFPHAAWLPDSYDGTVRTRFSRSWREWLRTSAAGGSGRPSPI